MTDTEFRDAVERAIRSHDVNADDLRALAHDLEQTAEKWDALEETL